MSILHIFNYLVMKRLIEARVSVISNENYYDVLVAASTCKSRLLEWKVCRVGACLEGHC